MLDADNNSSMVHSTSLPGQPKSASHQLQANEHTPDERYTQTFPFPPELDIRILSFIQENEFEHRIVTWGTLMSYSLACRRFRSLAFPRLFPLIITGYHGIDERRLPKKFVQALASKDEVAVRCALHIKSCVFNDAVYLPALIHRREPYFTSIIATTIRSILLLPGLTCLTVICVSIQPEILAMVFQATRIEELTLWGEMVPFGRSKEEYGNEICAVISTNATSLTSLTFKRSDISLNLKVLGAGNFKLQQFFLYEHLPGLHPRDLQPFLSEVSSITVLNLSYGLWDPESLACLAPTDLPHLCNVTCPLSCVPILLPGSRPIQTLHLLPCDNNRTIKSSDITLFVDALRRSSHSLRICDLKQLPSIVATSPRGQYAPHLEKLFCETPTSVTSTAKDAVAYLTDNVGGIDTPDRSFGWKNLSEVGIQLDKAFNERHSDIDEYTLNLKLQKSQVIDMFKRFPSMLDVQMGFFIRWTRPVDAPEEWQVRVLESNHHVFERLAIKHAKTAATSLLEWDCNGVLAGILRRRSEMDPNVAYRIP